MKTFIIIFDNGEKEEWSGCGWNACPICYVPRKIEDKYFSDNKCELFKIVEISEDGYTLYVE